MRFVLVLLSACSVVTIACADTAPPASLVGAVRARLESQGHGEKPEFRHALVDLDEDGTEDAIVLITSRAWCGSGGCTMLVFRGTPDGFEWVSSSTITNEPIRVLLDRAHGWHSLAVRVRGGGISPRDAIMPFDGRRYPPNPSMQPQPTPAELSGSRLLLGSADSTTVPRAN